MIEADINYTYERYRQYYWFSLFRGAYYRYAKMAFNFATAILFALTVLSLTLFDNKVLALNTGVGTAVCIFFHLMGSVAIKWSIAKSPDLYLVSMKLTFMGDSFYTVRTDGKPVDTDTTNYAALHMVYEVRDAFYLYLTPTKSHLLLKKDLTKGTPEALRTLLQSKLPPEKYLLCK